MRLRPWLAIACGAILLDSCVPRRATRAPSTTLEQSPSPSVFQHRTYQDFQRLLGEAVLKQNVKVGGNIFQTTLADIIGVGANYHASVQQLEPGKYQRVDQMQIRGAITPGSLLVRSLKLSDATDFPVYLNIDATKEIEFRRTFSSGAQAANPRPLTWRDLPLTAAKARAMPTGWGVSIPTRVGLHVGGRQGTPASGAVGAYAAAGLFWAGDCRVVIVKVDDDHVRVKIAASKSSGLFLEAAAGANLRLFGYDPTGLINLDKMASRALGLDFFKANAKLVRDLEGLSFDYLVALDGEWGDKAYERLISEAWELRPSALRYIQADSMELSNLGFIDLTLPERLADYDTQFEESTRRVRRIFRGERVASGVESSGHVGLKVLRAKFQKSLTANELTSWNPDGSNERYLYQLFTDGHRNSTPFKMFIHPSQFTAGAIFGNNRLGEVADMVLTWERTYRSPTAQDISDLGAKFTAILGVPPALQSLDPAFVDPNQVLRARAMIVLNSGFWRAVRQLSRTNPDALARALYQARATVAPRFRGRDGAYAPGPATSPFNAVNNISRRLTGALAELARDLGTLRVEGVYYSTGADLINALAGLDRNLLDEATYEILETLNVDQSAEEIVPALLLNLAANLRPNLSFWQFETRYGIDRPEVDSQGVNPNAALQTRVAEIFLETSGGSLAR